ncbi:MAG: winged helix-turn-helix transcriptional regulator [Candidatus Thermoplasmatota archaeon]
MDLRPLLRPRHLTITVLVGLLAGATIAAASIDVDADVPADLSSPVSFPARAEGDHGEYAIWDSDVPTDPDPEAWRAPDRTFEFAWAADELHLDGHGERVWTNVLRTKDTYAVDGEFIERNETQFVRAGGLRLVASDHPSSDAWHQNGTGAVPTASTDTQQASRTVFYQDRPFWEGHPCLRLPTQGQALELTNGALDGFEQCRWITNGFQEAKVRLRAVGGQVGQREVLLEAFVQDIPFQELVGRMWLREGVAYPVRLEMATPDGHVDSLAVLRRFDAGATPLRMDAAAASSLPPLQMANRQQWGPDEAGVVHEFPLSAAFAAARDHPDYDGLRRFLQAHPDAYVLAATYAAYEVAERDDQRWTFAVTDGVTILSTDVLRRTDAPMSGAALVATLQGQPTSEITVTEDDGWFTTLLPLPPAELPEQMPTVASMFEQWAGYAADVGSLDVAPNAWAFSLAQDPDGPGGQGGFFVEAGHTQYTEEQALPTNLGQFGPRTWGWQTSRVVWQEDTDELTAFSEGNTSAIEAVATLPDNPAQPSPAPRLAGDSEATSMPASRSLFDFTRLERATIGLGAIGAALLYWFAPAVKNGVAGLFSRIRDDDLLENPSRRMLRDLVEQSPGIHHQELVRRLGKGKGGAEHHLRKLVEGGVLVSKPSPGYTCYWVAGQATRASVAAAPVLKSPVAQGILRLRQQSPGMSNADLARALGVRPATIHYHLERMTAAGVLIQGQVAPGTAVDGSATAAA